VTASRSADIVAVGMTTPLGATAARTAASVRAGISRFRETAVYDERGEPLVMSLVPDKDLPTVAPSLARSLPERSERMVRLASRALSESVAELPSPERVPVLLALPEAHPKAAALAGAEILQALAVQAGVAFDRRQSAVFAHGRAAGALALREALTRLESAPYVVVGGVDTFLDAETIDALFDEDRIQSEGVRDSFIPGEGAAFLLLAPPGSSRRTGHEPIGSVRAVGVGRERGHRYSAEPYLGDGLDQAFREAFAAGDLDEPVRAVCAGLNGESFFVKEFGVAFLRHRERFDEDVGIDHPIDCLGDPGAALAPLLVGLCALGISKGQRQAPCLAWCSSDAEARGAILLQP
jgi:3-oxoacyl-[acyl-carrier-protein] synthase I